MERPLAGELHDELAEIGLDDLDAGRLESRVQADLLGDHRLRLHHSRAPRSRARPTTWLRASAASAAKNTRPPTLLDVVGELLDVAVEVGQRLGPHAGDLVQGEPASRGCGARRRAQGLHVVLAVAQHALQRGIAQGALDAGVEGAARRAAARRPARGARARRRDPALHRPACDAALTPATPPPAPLPGGAPRPGCRAAADGPRCSSGSSCRARPAGRRRWPARASTFSSTMAVEMRAIFTAKVPPKPQHSSGCSSGRYSRPSTMASRRSGCSTSRPAGGACGTSGGRSRAVADVRATPPRRPPTAAGQFLDPEHVDQELRELEGARRQAAAAASSGRPANSRGNPSRTMAAHEPETETTYSLPAKARRNARARRARRVGVAGVVGRLAAAGLRRRESRRPRRGCAAPRPPPRPTRGKKRVAQAGDHERRPDGRRASSPPARCDGGRPWRPLTRRQRRQRRVAGRRIMSSHDSALPARGRERRGRSCRSGSAVRSGRQRIAPRASRRTRRTKLAPVPSAEALQVAAQRGAACASRPNEPSPRRPRRPPTLMRGRPGPIDSNCTTSRSDSRSTRRQRNGIHCSPGSDADDQLVQISRCQCAGPVATGSYTSALSRMVAMATPPYLIAMTLICPPAAPRRRPVATRHGRPVATPVRRVSRRTS